MSDLKWGLYLREPNWTLEQLQEFVKKAEDLGYHGIYTNDHLTGFDASVDGKEPYLEAWTFITAILMWSKKLHAGHAVLCQSFRNPALLAKMTASLDFLSNGRFELFLGAGWKEDEYLAYGFDFPSPGTRLQQLEEYVTIIRHSLDPSIEEWDFDGKFWKLTKHRNFPKPKTWPFPILLGGKGPRFIKMAARIADGLNTGHDLVEARQKFQAFDDHVNKLGMNPRTKIKSLFSSVRLFDSEEETREQVKKIISNNERLRGKNLQEVMDHYLWGTPEKIVEQLDSFITGTGTSHFILSIRASHGDPLARFKDEVISRL